MKTIPIYQVNIPEYKVKEFKKLSGDIHRTQFGTPVPIEYWESRPDFESAGEKIATYLRKHFDGERIGLRLLGSMEHADKSTDGLIQIIKKLGHDRYDEQRKGDRYDNVENKKIEIFVLDVEAGRKNSEQQIQYALESFYTHPIEERGTPIRIDIGIVYDLSQLEPVEHTYDGREHDVKTDGYVFKYPDRKPEAILAILKIL